MILHYISNNLRVPSVTRAANCFHRDSTENRVQCVTRMCLRHLGRNLILNLNSERNMVLFSHHSSFIVLTVDTQGSSQDCLLGLVLRDV